MKQTLSTISVTEISHLRHICHDDANDKDDGLNQTIAHDHRDDEEDDANGDGDGGDEVDKLADLNRRQLCRWSEDSYINYSTSLLIGVLPESREATRPAMLPITVSSPVLITTPLPTPSTTLVE